MKKHWKDILFFLCVALIATLLVLFIIKNSERRESRMTTRTYELVDKATETRTHRYMLVDNAIQTDHLLIWKTSTGQTIPCEAGQNSYYHYQVGKHYRFRIDPEGSERNQLENACKQ